jgi:hypothetical protein
MNPSIRCVKNKYVVDVEFDLATLEENLLMEAATARLDLKEYAVKAAYVVVAEDLYARVVRDTEPTDLWYFFDASCRKWQQCNDPYKKDS